MSLHRQIETLVPRMAGWDSFWGALLNLLVFGLAAVGGDWLVHQFEYLIEYGDRFGTVMDTTPHRLYMTPAGMVLAAIALGSALLTTRVLLGAFMRRRSLVRHLPPRVARWTSVERARLVGNSPAKTVVALGVLQIGIYFLQENIESMAAGQGWPGLAILIAPQHHTVVPLHLIAAACISILLWAVSIWLHSFRRAEHLAEMLVRLVTKQATVPPRLQPARSHIPNLRLIAGILGLRSPPLAA